MCASDQDYAVRVPAADFTSDGKGNYTADIQLGTNAYTLPFPLCGARITALLCEDADYIQLRHGKAGGPLICGTMPADASDLSVHIGDFGPYIHLHVAASSATDLFINFTSKKDS